MTKPANKAEASKVFTALKKQCAGWVYEGCEEPKLVKRPKGWEYAGQPAMWHIVWEGGPFQWTYSFPFGGRDQEFGTNLRDVSARFGDGVWVEAQNHWSVVVWKEAS
jgi:hypothetical protein